ASRSSLRPFGLTGRRRSGISDDRRPFAVVPTRDQPVTNVRIGFRKLDDGIGGIAPEMKDRAVNRIGESSREHELSPGLRFPREREVFFTERTAPLEDVGAVFVEK